MMGPTASGKTQLAMNLADQLDVRLISVDSAMVYRGMNIGTAKPSAELLRKYPHELVDIREPEDDYSVREFCDDADEQVARSFNDGKIPVLVGGTMMYFNAFKNGLTELPGHQPDVRRALVDQRNRCGLDYMHAKLAKIDPTAAEQIHPQNWVRVERALEVYQITGKPISELWQKQPRTSAVSRHGCKHFEFVLTEIPRELLHERIETRLNQMVADGIWEEIRSLRRRPELAATNLSMQAVGYKQAWEFLNKEELFEISDEARYRILVATRQIARRQLIWLRKWEGISEEHRLPCDPPVEKVMRAIERC